MRLVDADNARECFGGDGVTGAVMKRMFDSLPTIDAVPVVRRPGVQVLPRVTYKTAQPAHATVLPDGQARYGVPGQAG